MAGGEALAAATALEGLGFGAVAAASAPFLAAGAIVGGAVYLGQHARAAGRVRNSLRIAEEHVVAGGSPAPNGDDDDWISAKINQAQKHLNNARKYVKDVLGKTGRDLDSEITELQKRVDAMREGAANKPPEWE